MTSSTDPCPWCAESALESHSVSETGRRAALDVLACGACGEYWVEGEGEPLTQAALQRLGLLL